MSGTEAEAQIKIDEQSETYKKQIELYNLKIQEFLDILSPEPIPGRASSPNIPSILKKINLTEDVQYFSISYFYEGLKNLTEIKKGNVENINFLWFVNACIIKEDFLNETNDTKYNRLKNVTSSQFACKIKIIGGEKNITTQLTPYEKSFILEALPYLINKNKLNFIEKDVYSPKSFFSKMAQKIAIQEREIDERLQEHQTKADNLADFITKQHSKLNFVGLGNAFKQITKEKNTVKNNLENYLFITFIILIVIPLSTAIAIFCCGKPNYYICIPLVTIELLLLYAFRLFYQQYMFIKSELLQVNLRHSLCAFIESYMEFKKNNKDNTVDLFEQLIFSNIISDEKKVPATVDGLDSIANIIQAIKGRS